MSKKPQEPYRFPFQNSEIKLETAEFIFDQAEKYLASTIATASGLATRGLTLIQWQLPAFVALTGFIAAKNDHDVLFNAAVVVELAIIVALICSLRVYWIRYEHDPGSEPQKLAVKELLEHDKENQTLTFVLTEIENYQHRISFNLSKNKERVIWFQIAIVTLVCGLVGAFLYVLVSQTHQVIKLTTVPFW